MPCLQGTSVPLAKVEPGQVDARAGRAAYDFLNLAIDQALAHRIEALVTLPLQKEALHAAGIAHPGHTEILAERCGVADFAMMLYLPHPYAQGPAGLGVLHATLHVSLREVFDLLDIDRVLATIRLADESLRPLLPATFRARPRVAVAGLNPHAGEGGLFGDEEKTIIAPAIARALSQGIDVQGPIAADTLFARAFGRRVRRRRRHVPRPGPCRPEDPGLSPCSERHAGPAHRSDQCRPRHGLRHRGTKPGRYDEPARSRPRGRPARRGPPPARLLGHLASDRSELPASR